MRAFAGDGWSDLGIRPRIKGKEIWYVVSILVYPVCATIVLAVGIGIQAVSLSAPTEGAIALLVPAFVMLLVQQAIKNVFEEGAFRGYLAQKMFALGLNTFVAHILVGLLWGIWHIPYLRAITPYTTEGLATLVPRFLLAAIAASIVYGGIRLFSDSVWPAWLMHTVGGAFIGALILKGTFTISGGMLFFAAPVFEGLLMIVIFIAIGVGIAVVRRRRLASILTREAE